MKTKYQPKAGDVCEYNSNIFDKIEVMIVSPKPTYQGDYLAIQAIDLELNSGYIWRCHINNLKLIYRP